jgi:2-oxoisovalerate dehydrogenase E1 component
MEQAFWSLDAPLGRVCAAEVPIPYPKHLEGRLDPAGAGHRRRGQAPQMGR